LRNILKESQFKLLFIGSQHNNKMTINENLGIYIPSYIRHHIQNHVRTLNPTHLHTKLIHFGNQGLRQKFLGQSDSLKHVSFFAVMKKDNKMI
jgi:hypothetical protein